MWLSGFFATGFVGHTLRLLFRWPLQVGSWAVPPFVSVIIAVVTGILSFVLWKAGCGSCESSADK
jgi:hypothetical protein